VRLSTSLRLGLLFGALYFLQGLVEPSDGLIAQPMRARFERWGWDAAAIGGATFLASLPWVLKPLYGLLSDSLPIFGSRRRSYLVLVSGLGAAAMIMLASAPVDHGGMGLVLGLAVATVAVAFADVVVDAHMVEVAQPRGLTGTLQAVQWAAMYTATALAGVLGGRLSAPYYDQMALALAAGASLSMLALALLVVRDQAPGTGPIVPVLEDRLAAGELRLSQRARVAKPPAVAPAVAPSTGRGRLRVTLRELAAASRDPGLRSVLAFLMLWSFSPGYGAVHDYHLTRGLGLPETLYGDAAAVHAVACAVASVLYGLYCRRVSMPALLHAAIALGVLSSLVGALARDPVSLMWTSVVGGAAYMSATLAQLDLAARVCPPRIAGTVFATMMAAQNLSLGVAGWLGGWAYSWLFVAVGPVPAYAVLAAAGAAFTCGCWALLPALRRNSGSALQ
jgi:MFS family permease